MAPIPILPNLSQTLTDLSHDLLRRANHEDGKIYPFAPWIIVCVGMLNLAIGMGLYNANNDRRERNQDAREMAEGA